MSASKPRKPLIEPGSVLGGGPGVDVMSSVLNNYAERTGTPAPLTITPAEETAPAQVEPSETPSSPENSSPTETPTSIHTAVQPYIHTTVQTPGQPTDKMDGQPAVQSQGKPKRASAANRPTRTSPQKAIEDEVRSRTETPKRLCSYKIPEGIDDWLATYVYEHRAEKVTKQDLVTQAIGLLIVAKCGEREGSDPVATTNTANED